MSFLILNKNPNRFRLTSFTASTFLLVVCFLTASSSAKAQRRSVPGNGQRAVVVDERLSVLRDGPGLTARLLKRLGRGREVSILNAKRSIEGLTFYRIAVTRRTRGWIQREALVSPSRRGDDERLLKLIRESHNFDLIARASLFLDVFPKSTFRPVVLLILGAAAEDAGIKLSIDAVKRLDKGEMMATGAAAFSYFLNFNGLDRYRRLGIDFVFDAVKKQYHYDGASWREIVRRYPRSVEAVEARRRLESIALESSRSH